MAARPGGTFRSGQGDGGQRGGRHVMPTPAPSVGLGRPQSFPSGAGTSVNLPPRILVMACRVPFATRERVPMTQLGTHLTGVWFSVASPRPAAPTGLGPG